MTEPPSNTTILVVDDDPGITKAFDKILSSAGYRVVTTNSAKHALEELDQIRPHAIILDLRMPFIDGLGLLYRIRSREAQQYLPVLVVTGVVLTDDVSTEIASLGAKVLLKPVGVAELLAATRALLSVPEP